MGCKQFHLGLVTASGNSSVKNTTVKTAAAFNGAFDTITAAAPSASISLPKDSSVKTLNVNAAAPYTKIVGEGKIEKIVVKATGVTSQTVPEEYDIVNKK